MEISSELLVPVNELDPNVQYYLVALNPVGWALVKELIDGNYRTQSVVQEAVTEDSFNKFLIDMLGSAPSPKPKAEKPSLFKNLTEK